MALCDRMRAARTDRDMGQKEVADALGITQQQYSLYETGQRRIPGDLLRPFCLTVGISADYLLDLPKGLNRPR